MIFMRKVKNIHHLSKCYAQIYPDASRFPSRMTQKGDEIVRF